MRVKLQTINHTEFIARQQRNKYQLEWFYFENLPDSPVMTQSGCDRQISFIVMCLTLTHARVQCVCVCDAHAHAHTHSFMKKLKQCLTHAHTHTRTHTHSQYVRVHIKIFEQFQSFHSISINQA